MSEAADHTRHPAQLIRKLAMANAACRYQTARRYAHELLRLLSGLAPQLRYRALPLIVEIMLAFGEESAVVELVAGFPNDFLHSPRALGLAMSCLDASANGAADCLFAVAQRRLHASVLAARWEAGRLSGEAVLELLARHPLRVAMDPTLELLAFNIVKQSYPDLASRTMNRFLAAYGLRPLQVSRRPGCFLGRLSASSKEGHTAGGPLVSIIVAARNAQRTIAYAIDSLLAQSHENIEVLVCDDDSTDGTFDVLLERYGSDRCVRLFRSPRRQGTYNIRNELIPLARGSLVTFHDADDWSLPDRLALQVEAMQCRAVVACLSSWVRMREDGTVVFFRNGAAVRMSVVSLMMRKEVCLSCGPFRSALFGADFEFHQTLRTRYGDPRLARLQAPLILSLWSCDSLTRTPGAEALETGYRAPARRAYCEIVAQRTLRGPQAVTDTDIDAVLREYDNYVEPSGVIECLERRRSPANGSALERPAPPHAERGTRGVRPCAAGAWSVE